jgi:uncharacterized protein YkwD
VSSFRRHLTVAATAAVALALAVPAGASASACADTELLPTAETLPRVAASTLCLLNEQRAAAGLRPVAENAALTRASRDYSQLMVDLKFFAHESPDGTDVVDRVTRAGYLRPNEGGWVVGENLAWAQGNLASPRNVVQAWMDSPGHRHNILSGDYQEIGVGIVLGTPYPGPPGATFTTDFGAREGAQVPVPAATPATSATATTTPVASTKAKTAVKKARKKTVHKHSTNRSRSAAARARARAAKLRAARLRAARARAAKARSARTRARAAR